jgi:hypothetical protein
MKAPKRGSRRRTAGPSQATCQKMPRQARDGRFETIMNSITTVGLDADDTLWHCETLFRLTHNRFVELLADHGDEATHRGAAGRHRAAQPAALWLRGQGLHPVDDRDGAGADRRRGLHPGDPRNPGGGPRDAGPPDRDPCPASSTPWPLSERYRLVLITKGDLMDQEQQGRGLGPGRPVRRRRDRVREGPPDLRPCLRPPRHRRETRR